MKVILDLTVVPLGGGLSHSNYQLHANGANIEGEWDDVFAAVKQCHETLHEMGVPRISTVIKAGTRTDKAQTMEDKVASVQSKLG